MVEMEIGSNFKNFEESPFLIEAARKMVKEKFPTASILHIYRNKGLIVKVIL